MQIETRLARNDHGAAIEKWVLLEYPTRMVDIDTKLLRSFLSVASEKSISTAADRLGCSQATMSVRIQRLEGLLGQRLFERARLNLKLTAAGRDLLPSAQSVVAMHDRLIDRAGGRLVSGRVRLGVGEGNDVALVSRLRKCIEDDYANIELDVVCRPGRALAELISAGTLDLAIVILVEATTPAAVLSRPRLQWVAASRFVFADCRPVPVAFHPEGCLLREMGIAALQARNISWREALCTASDEVILDAVGAGTAITVMTERTIPAGLRAIARPSVLPPLGKVCVQLLETSGRQSEAVLAVRRVVSACSVN